VTRFFPGRELVAVEIGNQLGDLLPIRVGFGAEAALENRNSLFARGDNRAERCISPRGVGIAQSGPQLVPFLAAPFYLAWPLTWHHIGYVPDERRRIEAARNQTLAIRREGERVNFAGMTFETAQLLARRHVPKADGLIFFTARGQQAAPGGKGHRDDTACV